MDLFCDRIDPSLHHPSNRKCASAPNPVRRVYQQARRSTSPQIATRSVPAPYASASIA